MISLHTGKYPLTDLPFLKVIGARAMKVDVFIKRSTGQGIAGICGLGVLWDLVSRGRGVWQAGDSMGEVAAAQEHPRGCSETGGRAR